MAGCCKGIIHPHLLHNDGRHAPAIPLDHLSAIDGTKAALSQLLAHLDVVLQVTGKSTLDVSIFTSLMTHDTHLVGDRGLAYKCYASDLAIRLSQLVRPRSAGEPCL